MYMLLEDKLYYQKTRFTGLDQSFFFFFSKAESGTISGYYIWASMPFVQFSKKPIRGLNFKTAVVVLPSLPKRKRSGDGSIDALQVSMEFRPRNYIAEKEAHALPRVRADDHPLSAPSSLTHRQVLNFQIANSPWSDSNIITSS